MNMHAHGQQQQQQQQQQQLTITVAHSPTKRTPPPPRHPPWCIVASAREREKHTPRISPFYPRFIFMVDSGSPWAVSCFFFFVSVSVARLEVSLLCTQHRGFKQERP
jgi:hypothetical protein